jgi:hypothetical protein
MNTAKNSHRHRENVVIEYLILAGIIMVAAVLRFYKLGEWSFWGDEVFSLSGVDGLCSRRLIRATTALWAP